MPVPTPSRCFFASALLVLVAAAGSARADDDDFDRLGPYIGASLQGGSLLTADEAYANQLVDLGLVIVQIGPNDPSRNDSIESDVGLGFDVYVGYRAHKYLAAELEFEMIPDVDFDVRDGTLVEARTMAGTANLRAILPIGPIEPYVLAGVGVIDAELDDAQNLGVFFREGTDLLGRFGGGIDVHFAECVVVRTNIDYMMARGDLHELEYLSFGVGLQYRF